MRPSRAQVEAAIGVIMRVPGLFIIDYWWQHDRIKSVPMSLSGLCNAILTNLILLHGFLLLLLPIPQVRFLYTHFVSALLLLSSHFISKYYIQVEASLVRRFEADFAHIHAAALVAHALLAGLVFVLLDAPPLLCCYTLPVVARILDFPVDVLEALHNFGNALMCISVVYYFYVQLPALMFFIKDTYVNTMRLTIRYGWLGLVTLFWNKVFVPIHFLVFWLIGFAVKMTENVQEGPWYVIVLSSASAVCASPVTLVASSVTVAYFARLTLVGAQVLLHGTLAHPNDNPMHSGRTEGLTMLLLALQTGLTQLHLPGRAAVLLVILFIVTSSLLQSMLEITEPVVLALSASHSRNVPRHIRVLITCVFLVTFPIWLALQLAALFPVDFWMMIVLSSCILTSVEMGGLLVVYGLSVYDLFHRTEPWESLDDIVYMTRAFTKGLEFIVAVFVVGVGLWEWTTDKWTNASILLVHCYVNVWQRVQTGWKSFVLRREALRKTDLLPQASVEELQRHDDVCAICYSEMKAACRTGCQHYFHRTCLRKWLYIQDKCPLCHAAVEHKVQDSTL